jgi:hypothetical protein
MLPFEAVAWTVLLMNMPLTKADQFNQGTAQYRIVERCLEDPWYCVNNLAIEADATTRYLPNAHRTGRLAWYEQTWPHYLQMRDAPSLSELKRFHLTDDEVAESKRRVELFVAWTAERDSGLQWYYESVCRDGGNAGAAFRGYLDARDEDKSTYERRLGLKRMRDSMTYKEWTEGKFRRIVNAPENLVPKSK